MHILKVLAMVTIKQTNIHFPTIKIFIYYRTEKIKLRLQYIIRTAANIVQYICKNLSSHGKITMHATPSFIVRKYLFQSGFFFFFLSLYFSFIVLFLKVERQAKKFSPSFGDFFAFSTEEVKFILVSILA